MHQRSLYKYTWASGAAPDMRLSRCPDILGDVDESMKSMGEGRPQLRETIKGGDQGYPRLLTAADTTMAGGVGDGFRQNFALGLVAQSCK